MKTTIMKQPSINNSHNKTKDKIIELKDDENDNNDQNQNQNQQQSSIINHQY